MIFAVDFEAHAHEISSYAVKRKILSLNENAHKNVKNGPKMVKNPLFVKLC